jgi:uncharacterized membrane protein YvbJ
LYAITAVKRTLPMHYECSSCGIVLKKGKPAQKKQPGEQNRKVGVTRPEAQKSLELSKLIPIFAGLIGLVLVILIATGAFDSEPAVSVEVPSSGV